MAAHVEWQNAMVLTSPYGTLNLNAATGDRYLLVPQACDMGAPLRVTKDNIPQADGSIMHHRFTTGYEARLAMELWFGDAPACGADMTRMLDTINKHAFGLLNAGDDEGRLSWDVSGTAGDRMLDDIRLLDRVVASLGDGGIVTVSFSIDCAQPYALDLAQTTTHVPDGVATIINLTGNTPMFPVIKVNGATTGFTLENNSGPLPFPSFDWTSTYSTPIPGGQYGEISTFRNTFYLNGDGANLKPGIDFLVSDFWPLIVGANTIQIDGASCDILWQNAWA